MKWCPVLLQIGEERIRQAYNNCEYLLQTWNQAQTKTYEHQLKQRPRNWAICYRYLIYTLEAFEEEPAWLYLVDLEDGNKKIKVKNFGQENDVKFLSYNNGFLFASTEQEIRIINLPADKFTTQGQVFDAQDMTLKTLKPGLTIHGFLLNIHCVNDKYQLVAFETPDNQLDFSKLFLNNFNDNDNFTFKLEQYREVVPRNNGNARAPFVIDPIAKVKLVFSGGFNYSTVLRDSGKFDLYWNMSRKDSPDDKHALDIEMTTSAFFFKVKAEGENKEPIILGFDFKKRNNPSFQMAEPFEKDEIEWQKIHVKKVHNIVNLFTGIHIVRIGITMCVITHSKFASLFDLLEWKWVNHIEFETDIIKLFRHYKNKDSRFQTVLMSNGAIYIGVLNYDEYKEPVPTSKRSLKLEGTVIRCNEDIENNHTLYITVKEGNLYKMHVLYRAKLSQVKEVGDSSNENLSACCLQVRGDNSRVVFQNGTKYMLYEQSDNDGSLKLTQLRVYNSIPEIKGVLHSGTSYDIKEHMVVLDDKNLYVIKFNPAYKLRTYTGINCVGLQNFTKSFNYALCQDLPDSKFPGLRLFDMESIIKNIDNAETFLMLLKKIDIGAQGYFEFGANVVRFAFISSLTSIVIPPILHRNTNKLMGIKDMKEYIAYKVIKDRMITLTIEGDLTCWNILTGKLVSQYKAEGHNYKADYELHSKYKKGAVMLKSKAAVEGYKDDDFFFDWQLQTNMPNQNSFIKTTTFTVKRWLNLEILNEKEVKINLEYVHPSYAKEWLFINDRKDRLIVVLVNYRCFYYEAARINDDPAKPYKIKWQIKRQINDYPGDLENDAQRLEFFSPDFSRYIILDKELLQFKIKDTESNAVLFVVPKDLMPLSKGQDPSKVINRFKFLDSKTFIVVNEQGLEKKVSIDSNFEELQFNLRPMFNEDSMTDWKDKHYYVLRSELTTNQVLERLKRLSQTYKTSYFLHETRNVYDLYEDLITIDDNKFDFAECSFTFLHWSLINQLQKEKIKVNQLEEAVIQQICYNILPGGNTVLHQLGSVEQELLQIFKVAHPVEGEKGKFEIYFVPNLEGQTPIHLCIKNQDFKSIDTMLKYLIYYPADHHSRGIHMLYKDFIEQDLPEFLIYLDSRLKTTEKLMAFNKGCLKEDSIGIITCPLWYDENDVKGKLMQKKPVETRIRLEFIDMPAVYHFLDEDFDPFFDALASTQNLEFFKRKAIQKIIDFNYPAVVDAVTWTLFIPFCFFQAIFFIFINYVYENQGVNDIWNGLFYTMAAVLILFATYFIKNEVNQLRGEGIEYLYSFWNYIDLIPPFGMYVMVFMIGARDLLQVNVSSDVERTVLAIVTFFMWMKFLYFLRIFKETGYLIRMIIEVIKDMRNFFLVLLITVAAFGDSFSTIALGNQNTGGVVFTTGFFDGLIYTYRMILGDFDTTEFGNVAAPVVMILFLLCTVFNMIVMLNLLIAIISDSYARVTASSEQTTYQERASMIAENAYLVPQEIKERYGHQNRFLLIATDLEKELDQIKQDPVILKVEALKLTLDDTTKAIKDKVQDAIDKNTKNKEDLDKAIGAQKTEVSNVKTEVDKVLDGIKSLTSKLNSVQENVERIKKLQAGQEVEEVKEEPKKVEEAPKEQVKVFEEKLAPVHKHPLKKMLLSDVREAHSGKYQGWSCDGKNFNGCRGDFTVDSELHNIPTEQIFHCGICNFDFCAPCMIAYKDTHQHELFPMTLAQLQNEGGYKNGWVCDGRLFKQPACRNGGSKFNDVVYHDIGCFFDLCEQCMDFYNKSS